MSDQPRALKPISVQACRVALCCSGQEVVYRAATECGVRVRHVALDGRCSPGRQLYLPTQGPRARGGSCMIGSGGRLSITQAALELQRSRCACLRLGCARHKPRCTVPWTPRHAIWVMCSLAIQAMRALASNVRGRGRAETLPAAGVVGGSKQDGAERSGAYESTDPRECSNKQAPVP